MHRKYLLCAEMTEQKNKYIVRLPHNTLKFN